MSISLDFEINILRHLRGIISELPEPTRGKGKMVCVELALAIDTIERISEDAIRCIEQFNESDTVQGKREALREFTGHRLDLAIANSEREEALHAIRLFVREALR